MKLIVGLGNPGRRYRSTPHNVGYEVVEELAARRKLKWASARRLDADFCEGYIGGADCLLLKPTTYMNASGEAVAPLARGEKIEVAGDMLVVLDDIALELGSLRLRAQGSSGSHKGLRSVLRHLETDEVPRLRCGVHTPAADLFGELSDYVLTRWGSDRRPEVDAMVARAADAVEEWLLNGLVSAMNRYNTRNPADGQSA